MRLILLILWFAPALSIFAQTAPALKFDEFSADPSSTSSPLVDRGNRLAKRMLKEPKDSRVAIIFYNERKGVFPLDTGSEWAEYTKGILVNGYSIEASRIVIIPGGYRELATLEYWIVSALGSLPQPTPTIREDETVICPEINVGGDGFRHDRASPLRFSVAIKGNDPGAKVRIRWEVSDGRILAGDGTNLISVDLGESSATRITAGARLDGLNPECKNYASATTEVGKLAYKYAEIQYNYSYLAALLDGMMTELSADPRLRGFVIFYGPRVGSRREVHARIAAAKNLLRFRQFPDPDRISFIHGGFRENAGVELYLVPSGVSDPRPAPTVDEKFVVFTDAKKRRTVR